jgi:FMN phosphatase YigB (HAD superfamily)
MGVALGSIDNGGQGAPPRPEGSHVTTSRYLLFDLNGTLAVGRYPDWNRVLSDLGIPKRRGRELTLETFRAVAQGRGTLLDALSQVYAIEARDGFEAAILDGYVARITLRDHAIGVLQRLQRRYALYLCSDTVGAGKVVVDRLGLRRYFAKLYYSCDLGALKSERAFWARVLAEFPDARPAAFVMIGDNPRADAYWPNRLGMRTVLIDSAVSSPQDYVAKPQGVPDETPTHRITALTELLALLSG